MKEWFFLNNYIKDALNISELQYDLENISSDDKKNIKEYTQEEIVEEAEYVLSLYQEGGTSANEDLHCDDKKIRKEAENQIKQLKQYIKKYKEI